MHNLSVDRPNLTYFGGPGVLPGFTPTPISDDICEDDVTALSELNDIRENIFRGEETRHFLSWNCVVTLSTAERSFCDN
jgi:hypothetical protein